MRRRGDYIKDQRFKFKSGLQNKFLLTIKEGSNLTWKDLARKINVSEYSLKSELSPEKTTLPICLARKLLKVYPFEKLENIEKGWVEKTLDKNWGQVKAGNLGLKHITKPRNSEKLAEFIGAIVGDGHIWKKGIRITGNYYEIKHHYYLRKLIKNLFGLNARVFVPNSARTTCVTNVYSKELVNFLGEMGLRTGNKLKNKTRIPKWVFYEKEFMYGALRGLLDTDGGIYSKQKGYSRIFIELQNHCPETMRDINKLIKLSGFCPSKSSINIRIQNQDEVNKFFRLIGSSNPKNILRFQEFISNRAIPLKEELNERVLKYQGPQPLITRS